MWCILRTDGLDPWIVTRCYIWEAPAIRSTDSVVTDNPTILLGYAVSDSLVGGSGSTRNT